MANQKDFQNRTLDLEADKIEIQGDVATADIAASGAQVGLLKQQVAELKATGEAELAEAKRAAVSFDNEQRLLGNEKITAEDGSVSYVYNEQLFAETKPEREAARLAGSPVAAAVQTIKENTESMIAARNENPDDPRYMKEVKGTDGTSTQVPMTDADLRQLANQQYQASQQSTQTLQANEMIKGIDNRIKALNTERQKLIDSVVGSDDVEKGEDGLTDKQRKLKALDGALVTLEQARAQWAGMLSAGPGAATRYTGGSVYPPPGGTTDGGSNSAFDQFKSEVEGK